MEIKNTFLKDLGIDMGNPMIQVEHCPEVDDARTFGVDVGNGQDKCGLIVWGVGLFEHLNNEYYLDSVLTKDIVMKMLNGDTEV